MFLVQKPLLEMFRAIEPLISAGLAWSMLISLENR
jgi:hypothetical protein